MGPADDPDGGDRASDTKRAEPDEKPPGLDDLIFEFAHAYGSLPTGDMPWPLFMAGVQRVARFDARAMLTAMVGSGSGVAQAFSGDESGAIEATTRQLKQLAYGTGTGKSKPTWALKQSED